RGLVHPARRIRRLLGCVSLDEQRAFYAREWNNRRWRALFALMGGKAALQRVYRPAFFRHAEQARFSDHFRDRLEHTLTRLPVARNYFLHQLLTGRYPSDPAALPPYLADARALAGAEERLQIVDGGYTSFLATLPDACVDAFALSNICEWMPAEAVDALFAEVRRTARPGARLVLRNFVGWTEVPERWRGIIIEDRSVGDALMAADRALFQRRIAPCVVRREAA
ncbi:MAG: BtaA family protein, partial [Gemmatimonadetes bacterium]|nr:BtaA family protein [Gemmatimonadota bacterium]